MGTIVPAVKLPLPVPLMMLTEKIIGLTVNNNGISLLTGLPLVVVIVNVPVCFELPQNPRPKR